MQNYYDKRIFLCETRKLSYDSATFFLEQIQNALEELGVQVDHCVVQEDGSDLERLEQYENRSYDAILDMNSYLPRIVEDDGTPFLQRLQGPFYQYLVDHPIHVDPILGQATSLQHVICLDPLHATYCQEHYPSLASAQAIPLAGTVAGQPALPFAERKQAVLFPGTYMPLSYYEQKLQAVDPRLPKVAEEMAESYMQGETVSPCNGLPEPLQTIDAMRYTDRYIREYSRQKILHAVAGTGVTLYVCGAHWEQADFLTASVKRLPAMRYADLLQLMQQYQVLLNVQPLFVHAFHDRVLNGMANGMVVLSDTMSDVREQTVPIVSYTRKNLQEDLDTFISYFHTSGGMEEQAEAGYQFYKEQGDWRTWCERFLSLL